jgi:hypothetical protein
MEPKTCASCAHFYADDRDTVYRREQMYFCRSSPYPMSRRYRVGEGSRVAPDTPACPRWKARQIQA